MQPRLLELPLASAAACGARCLTLHAHVLQAAVPSGRRLLASATSAQVYTELDGSSHDALAGITADLKSVISNGKLGVRC